MPASQTISLATALVTGAFTAMVLHRYRPRRRHHLLPWRTGLAVHSLATLSQAILADTSTPRSTRQA